MKELVKYMMIGMKKIFQNNFGSIKIISIFEP